MSPGAAFSGAREGVSRWVGGLEAAVLLQVSEKDRARGRERDPGRSLTCWADALDRLSTLLWTVRGDRGLARSETELKLFSLSQWGSTEPCCVCVCVCGSVLSWEAAQYKDRKKLLFVIYSIIDQPSLYQRS